MHWGHGPFRYFLFILSLFCYANGSAQTVGDYQTVANGNWNVLGTWNTWNGASWVAPVAAPNSTNGVITIQAGHTVSITAVVTFDEVIVNGTLNTATAIQPTLAQGTGVDLTINGTFTDNNTTANQMVWTAGATWQMGAAGTLIKTNTSSSNNWQSNYQGGITNIPATSNWIVRKTVMAQPPMSSTTPASGSVYPNLTLENMTATTWTTAAGSSFTGFAINVTVKGNLDIGGSGVQNVNFLNGNTHANHTVVRGNVLVRAGSTIRNEGTGLEIQGNLTVNGTISYDANDARRIVFSGTNNQTVSGTGTLNVYDLTMNKTSGTVTLNRTVTVNNLTTFTSGVMNTSAANLLIIAATGTVTGANNTSYVDGPVRYLGTSAFTFPVGENGDYQSIGISGYTAVLPIWTENFNNGCTQLCPASSYPGWSVTNTGANGTSANDFYISCAENGNAVGGCGTGCGSDATLHLGNVSTSPAAFIFCPTGDCGAAYDAGVGSGTCLTSKRAESPTINCTGYTNVIFSFKYMEGGQNTNDNALAWYFDGAVWTMVADMAKTVVCSGQGTWTAYSIALPASANNNPNVKIGFEWVNNDDGSGADPSFAVDNVQLGVVEYFTAEYFHTDPQVPYGSTIVPSLQYLSSCEYWILDRAPGTATSTSVTLAWDANSCPVWALSDVRVARYDGISTWQDEGNASTTGTTAAGTVTSNAVTTFSPFTLAAITTNPLPVTLVNFTAVYNDGVVNVDWVTQSELNNDYFIVERAEEGGEFIPIGHIDGHGTTSQQHVYHLTDYTPPPGVLYYRLKQVDFDGQFAYSPLRIVSTDENALLDILSMETTEGQLLLNVIAAEGSTVSLNIVDAAGRCVYSGQQVIQTQPTRFASGILSAGIYFVQISDGSRVVNRKVSVY
ncbi:MAG TPA: T9SS type A sorting domain-containing protein [Bacteroidia bacterium]|nr:T9SS type A sorting domain-containing protein [Bacteroidia bacterium]